MYSVCSWRSSIGENINYIYYFTYFYPYSTHPYWDEFNLDIEPKIREKVEGLKKSIGELESSYKGLYETVKDTHDNISQLITSINEVEKTVETSICRLTQYIRTQIQIYKEKIQQSIRVIDSIINNILSCLRVYIGEQLKRIVEKLQCINYRISQNLIHIISELFKLQCKVHDLQTKAKSDMEKIIGEDFKNSGIDDYIGFLDELSKNISNQILLSNQKLVEILNHVSNFKNYLNYINKIWLNYDPSIDTLIKQVYYLENVSESLENDYIKSSEQKTKQMYDDLGNLYSNYDEIKYHLDVIDSRSKDYVEITKTYDFKIRMNGFQYGTSYVTQISERRNHLLPNRKLVSLFYPPLFSLGKEIDCLEQVLDVRKNLQVIKKVLVKLNYIEFFKDKLLDNIEKIYSLSWEKSEGVLEKEIMCYLFEYFVNVCSIGKVVENLLKNQIKNKPFGNNYLLNVKSQLEQINDKLNDLKKYGRNIENLKYITSVILELKEIQEKIRKEINRLQERFKRLKTFRSKLFSTLGNLASIGCSIEESVLMGQELLNSNEMSKIIQKIHQLSDSIHQLNIKVYDDIFSENFKVVLKARVEDLEYVNASILFVGDELTKVTKRLGKYSRVYKDNNKDDKGVLQGIKQEIDKIKTTEIKTIEVNIEAIKKAGEEIPEKYKPYTEKFSAFKEALNNLETCLDYLIRDFLNCSLGTKICNLKRHLRDTSHTICPNTNTSSSCNTKSSSECNCCDSECNISFSDVRVGSSVTTTKTGLATDHDVTDVTTPASPGGCETSLREPVVALIQIVF